MSEYDSIINHVEFYMSKADKIDPYADRKIILGYGVVDILKKSSVIIAEKQHKLKMFDCPVEIDADNQWNIKVFIEVR